MNNAFFIGADIGGSHISVSIIDGVSMQIVGNTFRAKINTEIEATNFIEVLINLIKQCSTSLQEKKITAICLAFPGAFDYENGIGLYDGSNKKFEKLYGLNIRETLANELQTSIPIFFCNDDLAQGALLAALRLKIAVPSRIAIAGFNDLTGSDQMLPPLTSVRTPRAQIGEAGANMLLALMRGETQAQSCVDLGFELVQRGST